MAIQKEETHAFSVKFPITVLEEIDQICRSTHVSRTSWLIRAAKSFLEKERVENIEKILAKLIDQEK